MVYYLRPFGPTFGVAVLFVFQLVITVRMTPLRALSVLMVSPFVAYPFVKDGTGKELPFMAGTKNDTNSDSVCKLRIASQYIYTEGEMKSKIGENKRLFLFNFSKHDKPIHFECFQNLIETRCENQYLTTCSADGKESAVFVCGKQ